LSRLDAEHAGGDVGERHAAADRRFPGRMPRRW
jgi:hypothetical protein